MNYERHELVEKAYQSLLLHKIQHFDGLKIREKKLLIQMSKEGFSLYKSNMFTDLKTRMENIDIMIDALPNRSLHYFHYNIGLCVLTIIGGFLSIHLQY